MITKSYCLQKWDALWFIIKYFKSWLLPNMPHQGFTHKPSRCFILVWTTVHWVTILGPLGKESSLDSWGRRHSKQFFKYDLYQHCDVFTEETVCFLVLVLQYIYWSQKLFWLVKYLACIGSIRLSKNFRLIQLPLEVLKNVHLVKIQHQP